MPSEAFEATGERHTSVRLDARAVERMREVRESCPEFTIRGMVDWFVARNMEGSDPITDPGSWEPLRAHGDGTSPADSDAVAADVLDGVGKMLAAHLQRCREDNAEMIEKLAAEVREAALRDGGLASCDDGAIEALGSSLRESVASAQRAVSADVASLREEVSETVREEIGGLRDKMSSMSLAVDGKLAQTAGSEELIANALDALKDIKRGLLAHYQFGSEYAIRMAECLLQLQPDNKVVKEALYGRCVPRMWPTGDDRFPYVRVNDAGDIVAADPPPEVTWNEPSEEQPAKRTWKDCGRSGGRGADGDGGDKGAWA